MKLYNTLSRSIEPFEPLHKSEVHLYACGPTVYDNAHIGHVRKYCMDDVLVRFLRYIGFTVTHVMNITDVGHLVSDADTGEDKLEKGAKREGKTAWEIAKQYEAQFFKSMDIVGIKRPDIICRATDHIQEQIDLIKRLEEKGFTYKVDDGIYFDSTKSKNYGYLARFDPTKQKGGARVEMVPGKKHPTDFALWKLTPKGEKRDMEWLSPWGRGFPGWHIECSAMSMKYLGETIDIHTGGIDHVSIHHPNEIAQSEAVTGKLFVRFWIHHNFVTVDGTKMSKSLNNFFTVDDVEKRNISPLALRYLYLQTHYRQEANFTWDGLMGAQTALKNLWDTFAVLQKQTQVKERETLSEEKLTKVNELREEFIMSLKDDLNTPQALATVWKIVKSNIPGRDKYDLLLIADEILELGLKDHKQDEVIIPQEIKDLVSKREAYRKEKKWQEADEVRKEIESKGFTLEDTSDGIKVQKK